MAERKSILLRLDPAVHDALAKWAADEMRSTNAQIEFVSAAPSVTRAGCRGRAGDAPPGRPRRRRRESVSGPSTSKLGHKDDWHGDMTALIPA